MEFICQLWKYLIVLSRTELILTVKINQNNFQICAPLLGLSSSIFGIQDKYQKLFKMKITIKEIKLFLLSVNGYLNGVMFLMSLLNL